MTRLLTAWCHIALKLKPAIPKIFKILRLQLPRFNYSLGQNTINYETFPANVSYDFADSPHEQNHNTGNCLQILHIVAQFFISFISFSLI